MMMIVCFRGEAGNALGARGHGVRAVPPLLRVCQPAGVRALPGGHELHLPGRQGGGAAPEDPGYHQRQPQVAHAGCDLVVIV